MFSRWQSMSITCVCVCTCVMCVGVIQIVLLICAAQCSNLPPLSQHPRTFTCSIKYANLFRACCTLLEASHLDPSPSPSPSLSRNMDTWPVYKHFGIQWESASLFASVEGTHPLCPFGSAACSPNKLLVEEQGPSGKNSLCYSWQVRIHQLSLPLLFSLSGIC